jgi:hypothetical protein
VASAATAIGWAVSASAQSESIALVGAVERSYPHAALAAGIDGVASLDCRRNEAGHLGPCELLSESPRDHGFGRAALAIVSRKERYRSASAPWTGRLSLTLAFRHSPRSIEFRAHRLHEEIAEESAVALARARGVPAPEEIVLARRGWAWQPGEWNAFYTDAAHLPRSALCGATAFHVWGGFGDGPWDARHLIWDVPTRYRRYVVTSTQSATCPAEPDLFFAAPSDEAALSGVALLARVRRALAYRGTRAECVGIRPPQASPSAPPSDISSCTNPVAAIRSLRTGDLRLVQHDDVETRFIFHTRRVATLPKGWLGLQEWTLTVSNENPLRVTLQRGY